MNPLLSAALGSILRSALLFAAGWLVQHGIWSQSAATTYVEAAVLGLLTLGWSLWQKYQARLAFLSARDLKESASDADVASNATLPHIKAQAFDPPR